MDLYRSHAVNFLPDMDKGTLLPPFTSVPGLGEDGGLVHHGAAPGPGSSSPSRSFPPPAPRCPRPIIEQLKAAGALDGLPDTSQITLFEMF